MKDKTLVELEKQDRQLYLQTPNLEESLLYQRKIELYKAMHLKVKQRVHRKLEDQSYLDSITERLVFNLVHYGTYLKKADQKVDQVAIPNLKRALSYDPHNPIAAYRLGFIYYRSGNFINAVNYFQKAILSERFNLNKRMALTERQKVNAQLYLTNSALHIAKESQENLAKFPADQVEKLPGYEFSSLYDTITDNDAYLSNHAYYQETPQGKTTCSKLHCDELAMDNPEDTIVLYFGDVETSVSFNGKEETLTKRTSDVLRHLLTSSSAGAPANTHDVKECFGDLKPDQDVPWSTYRQAVSRVRQALKACAIPDVIETATEKKAYYYNGSFPYIIFYRVDDEIE
ncbi:tetratricopeptide repeat protein [Planococcus sp. ISL-110]|uniref:tetratricopeptide repeat protein n=1 Tax=Planococcus sp. ISL-110 TaxID=2819167 RepID=UPI001BE848F7|nr:tetratricopeptide repeat protein [Planococcus sp. ISL-110]MBT2571780.1 tetratricopeptide repeat protein [Planococcus sp. ISL-110]